MLTDLLLTGIYGWLVGSLVNYLADVLPHHRRLHAPVCVHCHARKSWWSVLYPAGCKSCGKYPGLRPWLVYTFFLITSYWLRENYPPRLGFYLATLLLAYFCLVTVTDMEYRVVLNEVSIAGGLIGLVAGIYLHGITKTLLGGAAGFGAMLIFYSFGVYYLRRRKAQADGASDDDALGFGDVNLSGIIGLLLGWPGIIAGLFLGVFLGGVVSLAIFLSMLARRQYHPDAAIPYGPFLAASAAILLIFRSALL